MEKNFEKEYHNLETHHWWFKSRRKYILDYISKAPKNSKIIDIGCSSGILIKELVENGFAIENLYGIDISEVAIANCKANGIINSFVMDAQNIDLIEKFDIIISSDCLEHLKDEKKAIRNWESILKSGGTMLVFVPAFQSLWSDHDVVNMHYKRYTKGELERLLISENLEIIKSSYWNFFLFLPIYFYKRTSSFFQKNKTEVADISVGNDFINKLLYLVLNIENKILKYLNFPFGVSAFCVVKKK
ncbi:class I SAM-dependent methyltransferase [Flavobacterium sp.]|uniref:class I SAM-dependent methyltransferase n=1 Tax=Flavobacterium sp. TaxID=239 RepID=UPI003BEE4DA0